MDLPRETSQPSTSNLQELWADGHLSPLELEVLRLGGALGALVVCQGNADITGLSSQIFKKTMKNMESTRDLLVIYGCLIIFFIFYKVFYTCFKRVFW